MKCSIKATIDEKLMLRRVEGADRYWERFAPTFERSTMANKVMRELEEAKHSQDLPEISNAAELQRKAEQRRTEQEHEVNTRHEAMLEASARSYFFEHSCTEE
jgi:lysyl-tRNA synthetase class I